jgi:hypothetical protein
LKHQMKENFDRFKFALYKEKEMPEFRKWITALAGVALFAGLASAQVGGPSTNTGNFTCATTAAVTPNLRAEGFTDLTGDILLQCSGGISPVTNTGVPIPTANFVVYLNTAVTSRLLATTGGASEALLIIDESGANATETGYGPTVPQTLCSSVVFGAGTGGCTEYLGTSTVTGNTGDVPVSSPSSATACSAATPCAPGANVFQGIVSGNQVNFYGIPVLPPGTTGNRVYRITNIRANANGITAGGPTPGQVTASVSISSSNSILVNNSTLTVGYVQQGLSPTNTLLRNYGNTSNGSGSGTGFAQCSSASITSTSTTAALGLLQYSENFGTAFKIRQQSSPQNVPGTIYNSESGFVTGTTFTSPGTGTTYLPGQADYATRLKAVFTGVPSGVSIYVSTRDVTNAVTIPAGNPQAVLVVSETATDSTNDVGMGNAVQPGVPTASQTTTYQGPSTTAPFGPVGIAPVAITSTGTGQAVWEIINTNPATIDTVDFAVYLNYSASPGTGSPAPGTISVTMSFAPTPSGGAFTSTTGAAASSTLTIPRFSDSLDITKSLANFSTCTTALLYPYVINTNGFDTGVSIANTTTDPFGTTNQAGTCSLYFYGSSAPTVNPYVSPTVATGTVWASLASTLAPGFSGYMIMNCQFQDAHGFAFISDVGARNLAMGYLPLILTRSGTSPEALNN